jgi:hypothetical protein
MPRAAYFIRRRGDVCSIVKLHPDAGEEILETGLALVDAEMLYFICIGDPVREGVTPEDGSAADGDLPNRRPRQLTFKF